MILASFASLVTEMNIGTTPAGPGGNRNGSTADSNSVPRKRSYGSGKHSKKQNEKKQKKKKTKTRPPSSRRVLELGGVVHQGVCRRRQARVSEAGEAGLGLVTCMFLGPRRFHHAARCGVRR